LQLEQDVLKKANELIKKDVGIDRRLLTNREKAQLVDALTNAYTLTDLLNEVGLARSSYFYHRAKLDVADKYADVRRTMTEIFERNHRCYGYRRIKASLSELRLRVSEKVVQRLMKQEQLVAATSKRRRYGSYLGEISPAPANLPVRQEALVDAHVFFYEFIRLLQNVLLELQAADVSAKPVIATGSVPVTRIHPIRRD
jgi:hypothetical protein